MRFMVMHKMTDEMEKGLPPDLAIMEGVGKLIEEGAKDAVFISGEGLKPSSQRLHITYKGGKRTITQGPFSNPQELIGGFGLFSVRSKEEALAWLDRFAAVLGDVELFMGPVVEMWDLGLAPKPENAPLRFLSMQQANESAAGAAPPDEQKMAQMAALIDEMTRAGVLQATGALASTKEGARIRFDGKKRTVIDGPFAESKELIAGYAILDLPSKEAAIEWGERFGDVVRVNEVDVRLME